MRHRDVRIEHEDPFAAGLQAAQIDRTGEAVVLGGTEDVDASGSLERDLSGGFVGVIVDDGDVCVAKAEGFRSEELLCESGGVFPLAEVDDDDAELWMCLRRGVIVRSERSLDLRQRRGILRQMSKSGRSHGILPGQATGPSAAEREWTNIGTWLHAKQPQVVRSN